jgi:hypothetical protein
MPASKCEVASRLGVEATADGKRLIHRHTPVFGGMGRADACWDPGGERHPSQATHRDTPPEDVQRVAAGLLARGSLLLSGLPGAFPAPVTLLTAAHRLQLRGQPRHSLLAAAHRIPSWLSIPTRIDRTTTARHKPKPVAAVNSPVRGFASHVDEMSEPHHAPLGPAGIGFRLCLTR